MSLTKFYERDGITIYNGDCLEVMPKLDERFELLLTDPPYPGLKGNVIHRSQGGVASVIADSRSVGTPWDTSLNWVPLAWNIVDFGAMVFCSYHSVDSIKQSFPSESAVALASWHKRNSPLPVNNVPRFTVEFIWYFKKRPGLIWKELKTMYDIPKLSTGCCASPERILKANKRTAAHPTQKPLALINELLKVKARTIIDPFVGTGTTLVAAQREGRRAIGIEINEEYCKIAVERLRQRSLWQIPSLEPEEPKPRQVELEL